MKRTIALALSLFLFVSCVSVPGGRVGAAAKVWQLATATSAASAFPVFCQKNADDVWVILFLTAKHVVDKIDTNWHVNLDGHHFMSGGVVLSRHLTQDAALVLFTSPNYLAPVVLDDRDAIFAEEVWAVGYPGARHLVITAGLIGRPNHASADVFFGNSGGAVIDSSGKVIGIVVALLVTPSAVVEHVMYFVPITTVRDWLHYHGIST